MSSAWRQGTFPKRAVSGEASLRATPEIDHLCARLRGVIHLAALGMGLSVLLAGCWLAIVLDAALILSPGWRTLLPWLIAGCAAGVLALRLLRQRRKRSIVRLIERVNPQTGTVLTNAVALAVHTPQEATTEALRRQALRDGDSLAASLRVWPVCAREIRVLLIILFASLLPWGVLGVWLPEVYATVLPRFIEPGGDHPPFSFHKIVLQIQQDEVIYGSGCEVRAVVTGGVCDKLYLFSRPLPGSADGDRMEGSAQETATVMFRRSDGSFTIALNNLRQPLLLRAGDGRALSRGAQINIRYTPQITGLELEAEYPEYTGLKSGPVYSRQEGLRLPPGTRLRFLAHSNRQLLGGELRVLPLAGTPTALPLQLSGERSVGAEIVIEEAFSYELRITDCDGLVCVQPMRGTVLLRPDEAPRIYVLEPGRDAVATPQTTVKFSVRAEDDYGISRLLHIRGLNNSAGRSVTLRFQPQEQGRGAVYTGEFDLADLGVRPGDEISYFFEAVDNNPHEPNTASSRLYSLRIIALEDYESILRNYAAKRALFSNYYSIAQATRRLGERAKASAEKGAQNSVDETQALRKELAELLKNIDQTLSTNSLFDIESEFKDRLAEQRRAVASAQKALASETVTDGHLAEAARHLQEAAGQINEKIAKPAREIAEVARLLYLANLYAGLAQTQADLAKTSERFRQPEAEVQLRRISLRDYAERETVIARRLNELTQEMGQLLATLPDAERYHKLRDSARKFIGDVARLQIPHALLEAERGFGDGDGLSGVTTAHKAAELMLSLLSDCEGIGGEGESCLSFNPSLARAMGNSLQQILSAMSGGGGQGDGYSLYNEDLALYGPQAQMAGNPGGENSDDSGGSKSSLRATSSADHPESDDLPRALLPGSKAVHPQREAKCPVIYRGLAGDYFRAVVEGAIAAEEK